MIIVIMWFLLANSNKNIEIMIKKSHDKVWRIKQNYEEWKSGDLEKF